MNAVKKARDIQERRLTGNEDISYRADQGTGAPHWGGTSADVLKLKLLGMLELEQKSWMRGGNSSRELGKGAGNQATLSLTGHGKILDFFFFPNGLQSHWKFLIRRYDLSF